jgi:hypothetical protein
VEYQSTPDIRDYVWNRRSVAAHPAGANVADFAAKRRQSELGKPAPGASPLPS